MGLKIKTGGQTGVDQAAWRIAKVTGHATGGWMIANYMTETGPRPEFATDYGAELLPGVEGKPLNVAYRLRARANVRDSDGTIVFDSASSQATNNAYHDTKELGKPFRCVMLKFNEVDGRHWVSLGTASHRPHNIAEWIRENGIEVLNVGGNRESKAPGIGAFVEKYLAEVFQLLREEET
jgi:hypothetical protein